MNARSSRFIGVILGVTALALPALASGQGLTELLDFVKPTASKGLYRTDSLSRQRQDGIIELRALTPRVDGLTVNEQPTLFWFLSDRAQTMSARFCLRQRSVRSVPSLFECEIKAPILPGVHEIKLSDYPAIKLRSATDYSWAVSLRNQAGAEVPGGSFVSWIVFPDQSRIASLSDEVKRAPNDEVRFGLYMKNGYWYDALTTIVQLLDDSARQSRVYLNLYKRLLQQGDLDDVVKVADSPLASSRCVAK